MSLGGPGPKEVRYGHMKPLRPPQVNEESLIKRSQGGPAPCAQLAVSRPGYIYTMGRGRLFYIVRCRVAPVKSNLVIFWAKTRMIVVNLRI